jgi:two-component system cell cycle response regulator DivK
MSKRILVVEDQADNRQIIRDMLAATDYEVTEAESGEEALVAVARQRPDLILMDIQLPVMDGYEATRDRRGVCGEGHADFGRRATDFPFSR